MASDATASLALYPAGDGRIVVGRYFTDYDNFYADIEVDELIFFNKSLTIGEVQLLSAAV